MVNNLIIDKKLWYVIDYPMAAIILKITGLIEDYLGLREPIEDNIKDFPYEKLLSLCSCLSMIKSYSMANMPLVFDIVRKSISNKRNIQTLGQFDKINISDITQDEIESIKNNLIEHINTVQNIKKQLQNNEN